MRTRLSTFGVWTVIILALVLSPILGLLTPYVSLAILVPMMVTTVARGELREAYSTYEARAFVGVFVVMAVVCVVTAQRPTDALRAFNFTMLLLYGPLALIMRRERHSRPPELVPLLAAGGTAIGLLVVVLSLFVPLLRHDRPTGPNIGPIVLSNALLALGFVSLGGTLLRKGTASILFVLAPIAAIVATVITGSRGPLVSVPFAMLATIIIVWRYRFRGQPLAGLFVTGGYLIVAGAGASVLLHGRAATLPSIFQTLVDRGAVADETTRQRLALYRAGLQAFYNSPWVGHGWANIMGSVQPYLSAGDSALDRLPQLHNDVLNFAVGGGVVGVLCYVAIISTPLIGMVYSPLDRFRSFRLFGSLMITIVYIGGGLTDLMFGFEFHTYLFVTLTAVVSSMIDLSGETDRQSAAKSAA